MTLFTQLTKNCLNLSPLVYVDVGAMGGVSAYWRQLNDLVHVIAFEPDEREYALLKSLKHITYLPYALYHSEQELIFYISHESGKSSIYKPNHDVVKYFPFAERMNIVREVVIPREKVKTLDSALHTAQLKHVDFIKLDTQGSELDILKGGQLSLRNLYGVEIEVEFIQLYRGQPLFRDCDAFLDAHGFELVDLRRAFWKKKTFNDFIGRGQLVFGDALYLKRDDIFLDGLAGLNAQHVNERLLHAVMICMVYGLPDRAMMLMEKALERGLGQKEHVVEWKKVITDHVMNSGFPWLPGRPFIAKAFNRLAEIIRPQSHLKSFDGDRFIGNVRNQ